MARMLMRLDALLEGALSLVLIVGAASGRLGADDFPDPVGGALLAGLGAALIPIAVFLWRLGNHPVPARALRLVAAGNGVTAILLLVSLVAVSGFSTVGTVVAGAVIALLTSLATAQIAAAGQRESPARAAAA